MVTGEAHLEGASGVDNQQFDSLRPFIYTHYQALRKSILESSYKPSPVRKVEIPKTVGGMRMLGIPTVLDRLIQQCIYQYLSPLYEIEFSPQLWIQTRKECSPGSKESPGIFAKRIYVDNRAGPGEVLRQDKSSETAMPGLREGKRYPVIKINWMLSSEWDNGRRNNKSPSGGDATR